MDLVQALGVVAKATSLSSSWLDTQKTKVSLQNGHRWCTGARSCWELGGERVGLLSSGNQVTVLETPSTGAEPGKSLLPLCRVT